MVNSVALANFWPSFVVTAIIMLLWGDYTVGAWQAYKRYRMRGILREYMVAMMVILLALGSGIGIVLEFVPPPSTHDPWVIGTLSAMRAVMLSVGVWLAWDRRRYPKRTYRDGT